MWFLCNRSLYFQSLCLLFCHCAPWDILYSHTSPIVFAFQSTPFQARFSEPLPVIMQVTTLYLFSKDSQITPIPKQSALTTDRQPLTYDQSLAFTRLPFNITSLPSTNLVSQWVPPAVSLEGNQKKHGAHDPQLRDQRFDIR